MIMDLYEFSFQHESHIHPQGPQATDTVINKDNDFHTGVASRTHKCNCTMETMPYTMSSASSTACLTTSIIPSSPRQSAAISRKNLNAAFSPFSIQDVYTKSHHHQHKDSHVEIDNMESLYESFTSPPQPKLIYFPDNADKITTTQNHLHQNELDTNNMSTLDVAFDFVNNTREAKDDPQRTPPSTPVGSDLEVASVEAQVETAIDADQPTHRHKANIVGERNNKSEIKYNLVLQGGGVKGIALVGALSALERRGYCPEQIAGTSAGAVVGVLYAAGYRSSELKDIMNLSFSAHQQVFQDDQDCKCIPPFLVRALSFWNNLGVYQGDTFLEWFRTLLTAKGISTFRDLKNQNGEYKVFVVVADICYKRTVVLPRDSYKVLGIDPDDLDVGIAVRMSISIPLFYKPVIWKNRITNENLILVDGALASNFPLWVFDNSTNQDSQIPIVGLRLIDEEALRFQIDVDDTLDVSFGTYINQIIGTMLNARDNLCAEKSTDASVINIPTFGIRATDFDISKSQRQALYESGQSSIRKFFTREGSCSADDKSLNKSYDNPAGDRGLLQGQRMCGSDGDGQREVETVDGRPGQSRRHLHPGRRVTPRGPGSEQEDPGPWCPQRSSSREIQQTATCKCANSEVRTSEAMLLHSSHEYSIPHLQPVSTRAVNNRWESTNTIDMMGNPLVFEDWKSDARDCGHYNDACENKRSQSRLTDSWKFLEEFFGDWIEQ